VLFFANIYDIFNRFQAKRSYEVTYLKHPGQVTAHHKRIVGVGYFKMVQVTSLNRKSTRASEFKLQQDRFLINFGPIKAPTLLIKIN
jgi:hypothetical protein